MSEERDAVDRAYGTYLDHLSSCRKCLAPDVECGERIGLKAAVRKARDQSLEKMRADAAEVSRP